MESKIPKAALLEYLEINIGSASSFEKTISEQDGQDFARITGDFNPLHIDANFAEKTLFKRSIVHGMLFASLFSTLIGMYCPGENCLYFSQSVNFKLPVFYEDTLTVIGTVTQKNDAIRMITFKMEILKKNKTALSGEVKVTVMEK